MLPAKTSEQNKDLTTDSAWGSENASSKDLVIPKIQIAQANSKVCKEGFCRPGDLFHSLTKEILAAKGGKIEILPILCIGTWVITTPKPIGGGFPEFIRKEPLTPQNDSELWKIEDFEDGKPVVRNKCLTYLTLLVKDIKGFPFFIDFQNTNKGGGKLLSTIIQENKFKGHPAPHRVVELSSTEKSYKQNSWFIISVAPTREVKKDELAQAKKWYDIFSKAQVTAHMEAEEEDNGVS
jgi:hypothetical protein